eukprot:s5354_g4.t1
MEHGIYDGLLGDSLTDANLRGCAKTSKKQKKKDLQTSTGPAGELCSQGWVPPTFRRGQARDLYYDFEDENSINAGELCSQNGWEPPSVLRGQARQPYYDLEDEEDDVYDSFFGVPMVDVDLRGGPPFALYDFEDEDFSNAGEFCSQNGWEPPSVLLGQARQPHFDFEDEEDGAYDSFFRVFRADVDLRGGAKISTKQKKKNLQTSIGYAGELCSQGWVPPTLRRGQARHLHYDFEDEDSSNAGELCSQNGWEPPSVLRGQARQPYYDFEDEEDGVYDSFSGVSMADVDLRGGAKISTKQKKKNLQTSTIWTLNVGGLKGFWILLKMLQSLKDGDRPLVISTQEVSCGFQEWKATLNTIQSLGYKAYCTENIAWEKQTKGVVMLVKADVHSRQQGQLIHEAGSFVAVEVEGILMVNSYAPPREEAISCHVAELEQFILAQFWRGPSICMGDWNEQFESSYISILASMQGLSYLHVTDTSSTRWEGNRIIDYFLHSLDNQDVSCRTLDCKISDHKIVELTANLDIKNCMVATFMKQHAFCAPKWIPIAKWRSLFDEALQYGELDSWCEACAWTAKACEGSTQDTPTNQGIVDFCWTLTICKLLWALKRAFHLSLLCVPQDFIDQEEIARVTHLANHAQLTRAMPAKRKKRHFPSDHKAMPQRIRKARNRLGRMFEFKRHWNRRVSNPKTLAMEKKIFGDERGSLNLMP